MNCRKKILKKCVEKISEEKRGGERVEGSRRHVGPECQWEGRAGTVRYRVGLVRWFWGGEGGGWWTAIGPWA